MAMSNRDRVGRALELLSDGLDPFIQHALKAHLPPGKDWTLVLAAKDAGKGISKTYDRGDVQIQLRMLTESLGQGVFPFDEYLSRAEKSLASELRDVRDRWAHTQPFSGDDTYRALDTMERLLRAAGATPQADEIKRMRIDHQRREFDAGVIKTGGGTKTPDLGDPAIPSWREVLTPHPDIVAGTYVASEFAADLHEVALGSGADDYRNPVMFFRRTYLTDGLAELLRRAVRRLSGDLTADPVINLQTNFGGGKTHSMLAVWHLMSGHPASDYPQEFQELFAGVDIAGWRESVRRVALVGGAIPPGQAVHKPDGTTVCTLWGELAWQLGGAAAHERIAASDANGTNPGALLKDLLAAYAPCVILIDEWVAYARGLYVSDDLPGGTFDTQFTFAQTLTEAVSATPGALLLVSVPASERLADPNEHDPSDLETGGTHGREALRRLQQVIGRKSYEWRPASSQESFEIVRRRLFEDPDGNARTKIAVTAGRFVAFYRQHHGEFPRETLENDYEARIKAAYPIHPELFARLYEDWSSLEKFQRTRGVLRLMSGVMHALGQEGDNSPLIMPGSVPLDALGVRDELAKYLDDNWKPIVDSDIDGSTSLPVRIDRERPLFGRRALTRRIARALFIGSAPTLRRPHKGIERQRLFLGVAQPGDTVGNFGSSLQLLSDGATFLYSDGDRYWYDTQPSLNRKASEYADGLTPEDVWVQIVDRLTKFERQPVGQFAGVDIAPTSSGEIPEATGARLVILHPRYTHSTKGGSTALEFAESLLTARGTAGRVRRNMLIALGADSQRYAELDSAVRQYLAWRHLVGRIDELDLTQQQAAQVRRRRDETNRVVEQRIPSCYIWVFYPDQPEGATHEQTKPMKVEGSESHLALRASERLVKEQMLLSSIGPQLIRLDLDRRLHARWNKGWISVGELWDLYTRFPYLSRMRDQSVFTTAVASVLDEFDWEGGGFALATAYDEATGDFAGLAIPNGNDTFGSVSDSTLLVSPHLATAQRAREEAQVPPDDDDYYGNGHGGGKGGRKPKRPEKAPRVISNTRYNAHLSIKPETNLETQLRTAAVEVLQHLLADRPDALDITLTVTAEKLDGFGESTVRTVSENARTLGFGGNRFEDG